MIIFLGGEYFTLTAEEHQDTPLRLPSYGSCADYEAFRYVKELLDPSLGIWDGKVGSCSSMNLNIDNAAGEGDNSPNNDQEKENIDVSEGDLNQPVLNDNQTPIEFEGNWSTPGSNELAFDISFINSDSGTITYYSEGVEYPNRFKYNQDSMYQIFLNVGLEGEVTQIKLYLNQDGSITYEQGKKSYVLKRSGVSQLTNE